MSAVPTFLAVNWLDPKSLIDTFGTSGLLLVIFVESGIFPAPLPGDSLLFIAGLFSSTKAGSNDPHLHLGVVMIGSFVAAVVGAQVGYYIGKFFGTRLFKPDARIFKTEYLRRSARVLRTTRHVRRHPRPLHSVRAYDRARRRRARAR